MPNEQSKKTSSRKNAKSAKASKAKKVVKTTAKKIVKPIKVKAIEVQEVSLQDEGFEDIELVEVSNDTQLADPIEIDNNDYNLEPEPIQEAPMKDNPINLSDSGLFNPVKRREYAENPLMAEDKETNSAIEPEPEPTPEPVQEAKNYFGAKKMVVETGDTFKKLSEPEPEPVKEAVTDNVPQMSFQAPEIDTSDGANSAEHQIKEHVGRSTSDFLYENFENGIPELSYWYAKISDDKIKQTTAPDQFKDGVLEDIEKVNADTRKKLVISEWHRNNIKPALKDFCIERGIEQSIPAWAQLAFALVMFALVYGMMVMELKKSNEKLEKKMVDSLNEATNRLIEANKAQVESKAA